MISELEDEDMTRLEVDRVGLRTILGDTCKHTNADHSNGTTLVPLSKLLPKASQSDKWRVFFRPDSYAAAHYVRIDARHAKR